MDTGTAGTGTDFHTGTGKNWHINTRTGHFGKFGTTSIPVPDTLVSSVRHPYRYQAYTGTVPNTPVIRVILKTSLDVVVLAKSRDLCVMS